LNGNTDQGPGTNFDKLAVTGGTASIGPTSKFNAVLTNVNFTNSFWQTARTWEVLTATGGTLAPGSAFGSLTVTGADPSGFGSFGLGYVTGSPGSVMLNWAPVPEPGHVLAACAAAALVAGWCRRSSVATIWGG
jgi:hypothetical protein